MFEKPPQKIKEGKSKEIKEQAGLDLIAESNGSPWSKLVLSLVFLGEKRTATIMVDPGIQVHIKSEVEKDFEATNELLKRLGLSYQTSGIETVDGLRGYYYNFFTAVGVNSPMKCNFF